MKIHRIHPFGQQVAAHGKAIRTWWHCSGVCVAYTKMSVDLRYLRRWLRRAYVS